MINLRTCYVVVERKESSTFYQLRNDLYPLCELTAGEGRKIALCLCLSDCSKSCNLTTYTYHLSSVSDFCAYNYSTFIV